MNNKLNTEVAKTKLEADKTRLINKKNIFMTKREELRTELIETVTAFTTNTQTSINIVQNKLKAKRPPPFDKTKETLQRFLIKTYYYYKFYNQSLPFDLDKIQDTIANITRDTLK